MMIHRTTMRIAVISLVAACVGCPGSLEDPSRFSDGAGSCPDVPNDIFAKTCSTTGCHSAVDKMLGLDLQSPDVAARLVGVHAMGGPTQLLIDPVNPAMSAIYTKLTANPPFGVRMPFSEPPLDDATISCVLQWITQQVTDAGGSGDDGTAPMSDSSADDGPGSDDGSVPIGPQDAQSPPFDAGKAPDARAPVKDASSPGQDASVKDASAPPDAGSPADAKAE